MSHHNVVLTLNARGLRKIGSGVLCDMLGLRQKRLTLDPCIVVDQGH